MITVDANALSLTPKTNPEDMEKIKVLYEFLDERLNGLELKMKELSFEKLVITVDTAENDRTENN